MGTPIGDPFRRNYGTLQDGQKRDMHSVKLLYEAVWTELARLEVVYGKSRDVSIARTELQTSCMWAVRAVTKTGDQD